MKTTLIQYSDGGWTNHTSPFSKESPTLVLCFAAKEMLKQLPVFSSLKNTYPNATIALCSTAGEIFHHRVLDNSIIAAAIELEKTKICTATVNISDHRNSYEAAKTLALQLPPEQLSYVLVFSDGSMVNGTEMVKGLQEIVGEKVLVTGGLAADGSSFTSTLVGLNEEPREGNMIAIGFYGEHFSVAHGSGGGWDMFGLEKEITRSSGNVLYEIDDKNALDLYKKYLGPDAEKLPEAALLFPLAMTIHGSTTPVVRTILSIDEKEKAMVFAGDVPVGAKVRFMRSN
ncbi:MAG: FIST C-terminal domain-containing protein, partial [Bacteroidetes bacterium]|nr:FIST C-terminal domain-containing protein [Bacteroidota bacterium]